MTRNVVKTRFWPLVAVGALTLGSLSLVACGGGDGGGDDDIVPTGAFSHYVGDTLLVPTTAAQATMYGLDLDEAEPPRPDNALGNILATLAGQDVDVQTQINDAITAGDIVILHSVQAEALTNAAGASWRVLLAEKPATPPLFDGMDQLTVDVANSPENAKLLGSISGGQFVGGPAPITIKISLVEGGEPLSLNLVGTKIESTISATGCDGKLGGAITKSDLDTVIIPTVADLMNTTVMNDPGCMMTPPMCGSSAQTVLDLFDKGISCTADNEAEVCPTTASMCDTAGTMKCTCGAAACDGNLSGDGAISVAEIQNNSLIKSLLTPDVDLLDAGGTYQKDPAMRDGTKDALSLGVKFTCVPATFTVAGEAQ